MPFYDSLFFVNAADTAQLSIASLYVLIAARAKHDDADDRLVDVLAALRGFLCWN